jgi:3-hydroxyisobutyrate dehydrogenase-like beta-hydroxyacid dehydrogenase
MGQGIAQNIVAAGFPTAVWNRSQDKAERFAAAQTDDGGGVDVATTPAEAVAGADVIVTCLFDDESVLETTTGTDGILSGMQPTALHLGTTTVSPGCTRMLVEAHEAAVRRYVAAHVLGRPDVAARGELTILAGGSSADLEAGRPVLDAFGSNVVVVGDEPVAATTAKLIANATIVTVIELAGELASWAEQAGVAADVVQGIVSAVLSGSGAKAYVERVVAGTYEPGGFALNGGLKDVRMMRTAAEEVGVPVPVLDVIEHHLVQGQEAGLGEQDWSALVEIIRRDAGLPLRVDPRS